MTIKITYFVHGTTTDNENHIATGWAQGELSELGKKQILELKEIIKDKEFDVVFCSDLKRAVDSAEAIFGDREIPITKDKRLRECNYGDLNETDSKKVGAMAPECVNKPFPNGESYKDVEKRIHDFLEDLKKKNYKNVALIAHRAPQLALDVILKGKTWQQAFDEDWRKQGSAGWHPGWEYEYD